MTELAGRECTSAGATGNMSPVLSEQARSLELRLLQPDYSRSIYILPTSSHEYISEQFIKALQILDNSKNT